jgi:hypothetical protein
MEYRNKEFGGAALCGIIKFGGHGWDSKCKIARGASRHNKSGLQRWYRIGRLGIVICGTITWWQRLG